MIKYNLTINPKTNMYEVMFRIPTVEGKKKQKHLATGVNAVRGNKRKAEEVAKNIVSKWAAISQICCYATM